MEILENLGVARETGLGETISDLPPARPSSLTRDPSSTSLGKLDSLPPELLLHTFHFLDFRSLSHFSRVSLSAKAAVESFPAYKDMMAHAPETLTALSETRLIGRHTAGLLHQTLRSSRCTSCAAFGCFLFLPTCERACLQCIKDNCGLRVTTPGVAKACFCLTPAQAKKIPRMRSIPGRYGPVGTDIYRAAYNLVSVKDAKQLAIKIHGSEEAVVELWLPQIQHPQSLSGRLLQLYRELVQAPLGHSDSHARVTIRRGRIEDAYYGMASTRFPSVTGARAEHGRLCRGCQFMLGQMHRNELPEDVIVEEWDTILDDASRLRSERELGEHARTCKGVRVLLERGEITR